MIIDKEYDYAIIDAQYVLVRNFSIVKSRYAEYSYKEIIKLFLYSLFKLRREVVSFKVPILCWDTRNEAGVYEKSKYLINYKGDRPSQIDNYSTCLRAFEKKLPEDVSTEDAKLISLMSKELENYGKREQAKEEIINICESLGCINLVNKGFEADDLASLSADEILNNNETGILITVDGDWKGLVNSNVDYLKMNTNVIYTEGVLRDEIEWYGNLQDWKIADELFNYSHNNVYNPLRNLPEDHDFRTGAKNIFSMISENGINEVYKHLPEDMIEYVKNCWDSLDIKNNQPLLREYVCNRLKSYKLDYISYDKFVKTNSIGINTSYYTNFFIKNKDYDYNNEVREFGGVV